MFASTRNPLGWPNKSFQCVSCLVSEVSHRANQFWMDLSDNLAQCCVASEEQSSVVELRAECSAVKASVVHDMAVQCAL